MCCLTEQHLLLNTSATALCLAKALDNIKPPLNTRTHTCIHREPKPKATVIECSANTQTVAHERVRVCQGSSRVGWRGARDGLITPRTALEKALLPGLISLSIWPDAQVTSLRLLAVRRVLFGSHSYHPSQPPRLTPS